ncbi:MAG: FliH/SctL family protein [Phycisphaerae bacterium]
MVIKAGDATKIRPLLSTVDLADHLAEAQAVVDAARTKASALLDTASEESTGIKKEAYQSGFDEGYKDGLESGRIKGHEDAYAEAVVRFREEHQELLKTLTGVLKAVDDQKDAMMIAARHDVLALAIQAAKRLTYAVGALNNESVKGNLDRILALVGRRTDLQLRVNPADVDAIRSYCDELLGHLDEAAHTTFVEDETIAPGGCIVDFGDSQVDASLETQLDNLVQVLVGKHEDVDPPEADTQ